MILICTPKMFRFWGAYQFGVVSYELNFYINESFEQMALLLIFNPLRVPLLYCGFLAVKIVICDGSVIGSVLDNPGIACRPRIQKIQTMWNLGFARESALCRNHAVSQRRLMYGAVQNRRKLYAVLSVKNYAVNRVGKQAAVHAV